MDIFLDTGVQYAMERYRGGFLVTDGYHNRGVAGGTERIDQ